VDYEWDPAKAHANFAKHRILFADAATVLKDDPSLTDAERSAKRFAVLLSKTAYTPLSPLILSR